MNFFRTLALGLSLSAATQAFGVDYDYDRARRTWEDRDQELDAAEAELQRQINALRPYEQQVSDAQSQVDRLTSDVRTLRDRQRDLENDINDGRSLATRLRSERDALSAERSQTDADTRDVESELRQVTSENQADLRRLNDLDRQIASIEASDPNDPRLPDLRSQRSDLQNEINQQQAQMANLAQRSQNLRAHHVVLTNQIDAKVAEIARVDQQVRDDQTRLSDVRLQVSNKEDDLDDARDDLADAKAARDRQQRLVDRAQADRDVAYREERDAYNYYQQVLANYQAAYNAAVARGNADGASDGNREATDRAIPVGRADGDRDGTASGRAAGLTDSEGVARARGYNYGLHNGASDATLAAAYAAGRANGVSEATRKAHAEDYPNAYNLRLNELFAQPPTNTETHDIATSLPTIAGATGPLQSADPKPIGRVGAPAFSDAAEPSVSVPGPASTSPSVPTTDRRYFAPNCSSQPHADFIRACNDAYASSYPSGYVNGYRTQYNAAYGTAFRPAATTAYNAARTTSQPTIYATAAQSGATDLGTLDGFANELPTAQAREVAAGRAAVEALRQLGYMPLLRSVDIIQSVDDGNVSPGESVKLVVVLDNYGLKNAAQGKLRVRLTSATNAAFSVLLRDLPAISADTRVRLEGVLTGAAAEAAGQNLTLDAVLEEVQANGSGVAIDTATFQQGIRQPLDLQDVTFPAALAVGTAGTADLKITNNTTEPLAAVTLPLTLAGFGLTSTETDVDVPALSAGQSTVISVPVTPNEYASRSVPVGFTLQTAGIAGSTPQTLLKNKAVPATRVGQLEVCVPSCNTVAAIPLHVRAGGTLNIPSQFKFTGTTARNFEFGKLDTSDARIMAANGSTLRVGPGSWGPGSSPYDVTFGYVFPAALRGQTHWVQLYLKANNTRIQVLRIPVVVD